MNTAEIKNILRLFLGRFTDKFIELVKDQMAGISWSLFLYFTIAECVSVIVVLLIMHLMGKKVDLIKAVGWMLLLSFIFFVFEITYYNREAGTRAELRLDFDIRNLPNESLRQLCYEALNVILFIPIGILISWVNYERNFFMRVILASTYSLFGSMLIEVSQLITSRGYFEVSDLVMNTAGGILGGVVTAIIISIIRLIVKFGNKDEIET